MYCQLWARLMSWLIQKRTLENWIPRSEQNVAFASVPTFSVSSSSVIYLSHERSFLECNSVLTEYREAFQTDHWALIGRERQVQCRVTLPFPIWKKLPLQTTKLSRRCLPAQHTFFSLVSCFTGIFKHFLLPEVIWKCFFFLFCLKAQIYVKFHLLFFVFSLSLPPINMSKTPRPCTKKRTQSSQHQTQKPTIFFLPAILNNISIFHQYI